MRTTTFQGVSPTFAAELRTLGLPMRAYNALYRGIYGGVWPANPIADLKRLTEDDLMKAYNLGRISAQQITEALRRRSHGPT
jgi:DNA-directed RNA polymerase alpha subunit